MLVRGVYLSYSKKNRSRIMKKRSEKRGFTLIELLATITILGILLGIAIPSVMGYMNRGKETYYH